MTLLAGLTWITKAKQAVELGNATLRLASCENSPDRKAQLWLEAAAHFRSASMACEESAHSVLRLQEQASSEKMAAEQKVAP